MFKASCALYKLQQLFEIQPIYKARLSEIVAAVVKQLVVVQVVVVVGR